MNFRSLLPLSQLTRRAQLSLALLLYTMLIAGCSVNPVTGKNEIAWMSEAWEVNTGKQYYGFQQQAGGGDYSIDPALSRYVNQVGQRIAKVSDRPHLPYEFVVLNDSVPNAWALPGGKIAINRGLIDQLNNEAELAAVLAHEIVHAAARHSAQSQEMGTLIGLGSMAATVLLSSSGVDDQLAHAGIAYGGLYGQQRYSRTRELEADEYGMKYMRAAGYDPQGAVELQKTFVRLSQQRQSNLFDMLFASHPPSQSRVAANQQTAAQLPAGGTLGEANFQSQTRALRLRKPAYDYADKAAKALTEKQFGQALQLADQAIALERREGLFHELRGAALSGLERPREAMTSLNNAVSLNPNYYRPLVRRGLLRHEMNAVAGAESDLKASLKLAPTPTALLKLGEISEGRQNCREALRYYGMAAQQSQQLQQSLAPKIQNLQTICR